MVPFVPKVMQPLSVLKDVECTSTDLYSRLWGGKYLSIHLQFAVDLHGQLLFFLCVLVFPTLRSWLTSWWWAADWERGGGVTSALFIDSDQLIELLFDLTALWEKVTQPNAGKRCYRRHLVFHPGLSLLSLFFFFLWIYMPSGLNGLRLFPSCFNIL